MRGDEPDALADLGDADVLAGERLTKIHLKSRGSKSRPHWVTVNVPSSNG